jgi:hypothetical protein
MKRVGVSLGVALVLLLLPAQAFADVGVGVGTGKIDVKEPIRAGGIYTLPPITVFNTGDQEATYAMYVTLNEKQPQLKPDPAWFSFSPAEFNLKPKQSQVVTPTFSPPLVTQPGDYFAYLEARPSKTVKQGSTTIGVAAATKLSFSVAPSNIFVGLWYRLRDLYKQWWPWDLIVIIAALIAVTYRVLKKHFKIQISRNTPPSAPPAE